MTQTTNRVVVLTLLNQRNKVFNENNLDTMARMQDNYIDGIICSPPYNLGKNPNHRRLDQDDYNLYVENTDNLSEDEYLEIRIKEFQEFQRIVKTNGVICYNISYCKRSPILSQLLMAKVHNETDLTVTDVIFWKKTNSLPLQTSPNKLSRIVEPIFVIVNKSYLNTFKANKKVSKINEKTGQKFYKTYYNYIEARNNDGINSSLKAAYSEELVTKLLDIYFPPGSTIYDPFMGIFTTARACIKNNRNYIGSEINESIYKEGTETMKKLKPNKSFFEWE